MKYVFLLLAFSCFIHAADEKKSKLGPLRKLFTKAENKEGADQLPSKTWHQVIKRDRDTSLALFCYMPAQQFRALIGVGKICTNAPNQYWVYDVIDGGFEGHHKLPVQFVQVQSAERRRDLFRMLNLMYWRQPEKPSMKPGLQDNDDERHVMQQIAVQCRNGGQYPYLLEGLLKQLRGDDNYQVYFRLHDITMAVDQQEQMARDITMMHGRD